MRTTGHHGRVAHEVCVILVVTKHHPLKLASVPLAHVLDLKSLPTDLVTECGERASEGCVDSVWNYNALCHAFVIFRAGYVMFVHRTDQCMAPRRMFGAYRVMDWGQTTLRPNVHPRCAHQRRTGAGDEIVKDLRFPGN